MKMKIAVTGGIGSGKSTVLSLLKELGYATFSCDEIYQTLFNSKTYIAEIKRLFPSVVHDEKIDKTILSNLVFQNESARKQLNSLAHPIIMNALCKQMHECTQEIVFAEVPLLFEGKYQNLFDGVIVVMRPLEDRLQAVMQRDNVSIKTVETKMKTQFSYAIDDLNRQHDNLYLLDNNGSVEQLKNQLTKILKRLS